MKYEFVIEVNGKPSCEKCRFYEGSNGYDDSISCRLGGSGYCISDLLKKCKFKPKRELKAKQLEWENTYTGYKSFFEIYSIEDRGGHYIASIKNTPDKYCSTLKEAKQLCQDHYNKLFNEMIGATNETY